MYNAPHPHTPFAQPLPGPRGLQVLRGGSELQHVLPQITQRGNQGKRQPRQRRHGVVAHFMCKWCWWSVASCEYWWSARYWCVTLFRGYCFNRSVLLLCCVLKADVLSFSVCTPSKTKVCCVKSTYKFMVSENILHSQRKVQSSVQGEKYNNIQSSETITLHRDF